MEEQKGKKITRQTISFGGWNKTRDSNKERPNNYYKKLLKSSPQWTPKSFWRAKGRFVQSLVKYTMTFHYLKPFSTHGTKHVVDTVTTVSWEREIKSFRNRRTHWSWRDKHLSTTPILTCSFFPSQHTQGTFHSRYRAVAWPFRAKMALML